MMSGELHVSSEPSGGEGSYDSSKEDRPEDLEIGNEILADSREIINPFDFISKDHPRQPTRKTCILENARQVIRFRNHPEFWWDVLLAMNKQAKMKMSQEADRAIREEVISLAAEVRKLCREKDDAMRQKNIAEAKSADLAKKIQSL